MATNILVEVISGDVTGALTRLKKRSLKEGLFKEMQKRGSYEKPSIRKRRKQVAARKRMRKRERQVSVALVRVTEKVEARKQFGGRIYLGNGGR